VITAFRDRHPGMEVRIEQTAGDDPLAALLDNRVDVALVTKSDRLMEKVNAVPLVLYDIYDQSRPRAQPLPLPAGARPGRVSTVPLVTDLVIEMVASGEGVSVLPRWAALPFAEGPNRRVAMVQVGARPTWRTWRLATRVDDPSVAVGDFAELVAARFTAGTVSSAGAASAPPELVSLT
jgi:LysR family transcriptional regulator for metE and metH